MSSAEVAMRESLPPGSRLPRPIQTILFLRSRHRFAPIWRRKHGDTFTVRLAADRTVVVVSRPEDIREIFAGPSSVFHAGEGNAILEPVMGSQSVLILDEDAHLRSRKRLMPAFNGAALRGYAGMMTELAEKSADRWPVGKPFAVHPVMNALTLEIILRVVFGMAEGDRLARLRPLINKVVDIGPIAILGWTYPALSRFWPWTRNARNLADADALLHEEIAERRTQDLADRDDVLSRLLAADPDAPAAELRDHMMTLLLAGHETTATALAWSLHELARNPETLRAAQEAADNGDDDYLQAVTKEAMRLRPVIYSVARRLTEPTAVRGHLLPKGTIVTPSIGLVQHDPDNFAEPEEFRPERFIGAQPEAGTWIPFGGGVRRCLGAGFSLQEAAAVLRAVLVRYDIEPVGPPEATITRNITLVPAKGARIVARRR
ncbi:Cytochrome P450 [Actinokineospora alba]|uniref:Cytochrome P450 n=1 Tax=Actinokineospora alba TaxID=504798 RepID=A0A1H0MU36_9PSEU|nr:cytochrome P450 [Actinokineospora alba]TDP68436.1 cytochrome P450 [Actinokineospora alba]SDH79053.1 Cytochrome P450 [Actinokineospora alba]SDO83978.1 Cytochrome P450 [Actinokineospora alba]